MNIDELTVGQARELAAIFNTKSSTTPEPNGIQFGIGQKVIIRTYSAGVWFGTLSEKSENEVILKDARRLWYWKAKKSISLSAVANYGITDESKVPAPVEGVWLQAIEIIPCTQSSIDSIEGQRHAEPR